MSTRYATICGLGATLPDHAELPVPVLGPATNNLPPPIPLEYRELKKENGAPSPAPCRFARLRFACSILNCNPTTATSPTTEAFFHFILSRHPRSPEGRHTDKKRSVPIGPGQARTGRCRAGASYFFVAGREGAVCSTTVLLDLTSNSPAQLRKQTLTSLLLCPPSTCLPACLPVRLPASPRLVMPMPILTGPACQAGPEMLLLLLLTT